MDVPDRHQVIERVIEARRAHGENARDQAAALAAQALNAGELLEHQLWKHVHAALAVDPVEVDRRCQEIGAGHGRRADRFAAKLALAALADGEIEEYEFWKRVEEELASRGHNFKDAR